VGFELARHSGTGNFARRRPPHFAARYVCALFLCFAWIAVSTGAAHAQILVNKSFSPANIAPAGSSTLTIEILNNTAAPAANVSITDNLPASPAGLTVGPGGMLSNNCGGTVSAASGSTSIVLTGGSVPASVAGVAGRCVFTVQVTANPASPPASYVNTIPPANTSSTIGGSSTSATATLQVSSVNPITGSKTFAAANLHGNGAPSRFTIQLNNSNAFALTGVAFTDTFPTSMQLASAPNVTSTCGGSIAAASLGLTIGLSGGTIAANGNCVIQADIIVRSSDTTPQDSNSTNSIAANNVTSTQGARNTAAISRAIRVQKAATVSKAFSPAGIRAGGTSTLTLTLRNFNATPISGFSFTDAMPAGVTVTGGVSTTCTGGTASFTSGSVTVTGATLAAAPSGIANSSCTLTAQVTAAANGNFVNSVPAGTLSGIAFNAATATLQVSSVAGTKSFNPTTIPQSGTSLLTITLQNRSTAGAAAITSFTDNLTTMGTGFTVAPSPAATSTCGGTLSAAVGGTAITVTGGSIPVAPSTSTPGTCTITVPVQVGVNAPTGNRTNTVAVNGLQTSLGNNTATFTARLTVSNPIALTKSFSPSPVVSGSVTRLTITISRPANAALYTGLTVTDPLPSGYSVAAAPNATTTCTSGSIAAAPGATSVVLSGASLGTSVTASSSCTVQVNLQAPTATGSTANTIPVGNAAATTPSGTVKNTSSASANIAVVNGVTVNKAFAPSTIAPGGASRLTVFINNPASNATSLTGVTITDNFPAGLVVRSPANATFIASGGTCTGTLNAVPGAATISVTSGSITSGSTCELAVDVTTNAVGALNNVLNPGAVTSAQGQSNVNSASATLVSSGNADVSVSKDDGIASMIAGNTATYTVVIVNNSAALAVAGLPVTDDEPADMTFTGWTCAAASGSTCAAPSGTGPVATTVTLAPLGTATFTITARVSPDSALSSVTNTVSVDPAAAGVFDPVAANNSDGDTNTLTRTADVRITKTISNANPQVGSSVTFTISAINDGPSSAFGVEVSDPLPTGYDLSAATPSAGSFAAPIWDIGDMMPATTETLVLAVTVNPAGNYDNTAAVSAQTSDPSLANNSATVSPMTVGLRIEKTSVVISDPISGTSNPKAIPGAVLEYRIRVWNEGTASIDANSIIVEDKLPDVDTLITPASGPPIRFADGSTASGLTYNYASHVTWTNFPGGSPPYSYTPVPGGDGFDSAVTGFRVKPQGTMAPGSVSSPSSFEIIYRVRIR
jgi:uncharacterized repeat protein (TIGR01451 family)